MELFDLPVPLLASTASYLEAETLCRLDSAACNHQARPTLLEAFAQCHIDYKYGCKKLSPHILWLVQRNIKIATIEFNVDQSSYLLNHIAEFTAFLSMLRMNSYPYDIAPGVYALFPLLKSLKCEFIGYDRASADCFINFAATTPVTVTYAEYADGAGLIEQLSDRRFDHLPTGIEVFADNEYDFHLVDIDHHFNTVCLLS